MAYANLEKSEINLALAEKVLKDIISPNEKRVVTPELIINVVAEHFDLSPSDIVGNKEIQSGLPSPDCYVSVQRYDRDYPKKCR